MDIPEFPEYPSAMSGIPVMSGYPVKGKSCFHHPAIFMIPVSLPQSGGRGITELQHVCAAAGTPERKHNRAIAEGTLKIGLPDYVCSLLVAVQAQAGEQT